MPIFLARKQLTLIWKMIENKMMDLEAFILFPQLISFQLLPELVKFFGERFHTKLKARTKFLI